MGLTWIGLKSTSAKGREKFRSRNLQIGGTVEIPTDPGDASLPKNEGLLWLLPSSHMRAMRHRVPGSCRYLDRQQ